MRFGIKLGASIAMAALGMGLAGCPSSEGEGTGGASSASTADGAGGAGGAGQGGTSSVGSTASSSSTSGAGGGEFVDCPSSPINFSSGECDVLNPDCPAGKTCYPVKGSNGNMTTKCINWSGVKTLGAACTANEECAAGLFCGFYCSPPCCPTAGVSDCDCSITGAGFEIQGATIQLCNYLPNCDLFVADSCSKYPGSQCHLQKISEGLATCAPPAVDQMPPMEGKTCGFINDCEAMQTCQNGKCRYNCLVDSFMEHAVAEGGCPDGQKCSVLLQGNNIGVCQPP